MTKLISFVVFIAAFVSTWFLFHSSSRVSLATHAGIQSKFITLIEETVKAAKPNSSDFEILNIYTEKIDDNQIGVHFSYKYTDQLEDKEKINQIMSGDAILYRGLSENTENDKWVVKSIKTDKANLEFQQSVVVNPEVSAASSSDATDATKVEEKKNE
jgi:hypothetical protein